MKVLSEKDAARARKLVANVLKAERLRDRLYDKSDRIYRRAGLLYGDDYERKVEAGKRSDALVTRGCEVLRRHQRRLVAFIARRSDWAPSRWHCDPEDTPAMSMVLDGVLWCLATEHVAGDEFRHQLVRVDLAAAMGVG